MAAKKVKPAKGGYVVRVRYQLYIDGPSGENVIAGSRLLKGDTPTKPCPHILFATDDPKEAEKNRKALEVYLNSQA